MVLTQARRQDCRTQSGGGDLRAEGRRQRCLAGLFTGRGSPGQASGSCGGGPGDPTLLSSVVSTQRTISEQSFMALGSAWLSGVPATAQSPKEPASCPSPPLKGQPLLPEAAGSRARPALLLP